ncbi:MAG TPA: hypothetical protein ENH62_03175 [Marinobacter sp.]|nr:hypothetical protein [Marinobacter sp.]
MNKWENRCKKKCREIVMQGGRCENCGDGGHRKHDQHHGLFKTSQRYILNPFLRYDPTLQFCLCNDCHLHTDDAPHRDQAAFVERMIICCPHRVQRLLELYSKPVPPVIDPRIIDWKKVHANLVEHGRPLGNEILEGLA